MHLSRELVFGLLFAVCIITFFTTLNNYSSSTATAGENLQHAGMITLYAFLSTLGAMIIAAIGLKIATRKH